MKTSKNNTPINELGVSYFSSSKDSYFLHLQLNFPELFKYKIIKIFDNRKDAIEHEIFLHNKFDVGYNESFYNKAKQTSCGFDRSGIKLDEVHKEKISKKLKGRVFSEEHLTKISKKLKGRVFSEEHLTKLSEAKKGTNNGMYGKTLSNKHKSIISSIHKNKIVSEETKMKSSESWKLRPILICPHCNKEGKGGSMTRWHFNNCKNLTF